MGNSFTSCLVWQKGGNKTQNKQASVNRVVGSSAGKEHNGGCLKGQPEVSHINSGHNTHTKIYDKIHIFPLCYYFTQSYLGGKKMIKKGIEVMECLNIRFMKMKTLSLLPCFIPEPRIVEGTQIFWGYINKCLACDKPCAWYFTYISSFKSHT